ncbi:double-strand break repair helicase AddA [Rhodomicrobium vannielii ATCC 17100]|uniref:DNA 3'-5' helicase n=1 Tax=Rhodomicrobium vannielii (strain ATCC 17100 / DSM 162 / LMG 4299 / NCIMB 10020 / ATH 3.1.1) TaxID=648757 RepID=E3I6E8_RHOVT|nr:UvrD-helicase domain-containing protein [Rhodomicrobium vannielii]ADP69509.1 double-strand break repair helicase AddA [Rhodomicrobium vannielii ATCC 17100]
MSDALHDARLAEASRKQRSAADPSVSAWVRANAGTGKTHVLVQRILRLCLAGAAPRSILCLTFTKNAAAEMEARVLKTMGEWATADAATLEAALAALLDRPAEAGELAAARTLFATVTDAPGGLPIMTIHAFCERLLRRFSFEANVPPGFTVMTEEEARDALAAAKAAAFSEAKSGAMRDALATAVAHAGEDEFGRVLKDMLGHRRTIHYLLSVGPEGDRIAPVNARLRRIFGLAANETAASLIDRAAAVLSDETIREIVAIFAEGGKTEAEIAASLRLAMSAPDAASKCACIKKALGTKGGEPKKRLATAPTQRRAPSLCERLSRAQTDFFDLDRKICAAKVVAATAALFRLAAAIFDAYEAEKRARGAVDFDDLIEKTLALLHREDAAEWVLYQLDGRIDHVLVDEAQDTSPEQWAIVAALTAEFFSGESARATMPTLFAVGDEKQSIYGFQGARPEFLAAFGAAYEQKARATQMPFRTIGLDLSFRTLAPVLSAVDHVSAALGGGLSTAPMPHIANRDDDGGLVELWQPERGARQDKGDVWVPEDDAATSAKPAEALASRIATKVRGWLDGGAALGREGRPVDPGDIIILLKKRQPMASLLQAALKREGVPVAGADRMSLVDDLAVMDLLALGDALLQPEDDLALAAALKSPLFGLSDDDLFALRNPREGSLWAALGARAEAEAVGRFAEAAARLASWRDLAHRLSPFDFYAQVLDHPLPAASDSDDGRGGQADDPHIGGASVASFGEDTNHFRGVGGDDMSTGKIDSISLSTETRYASAAAHTPPDGRAAFGARLGPQCFEALDEFSNLAETFSAGGRGDLADFLVFVRHGAAEVKRETDQATREVRIMTVHGAKGLEAPIVILADACGARAGRQPPILLLEDRADGVRVPVWTIKGAGALPPVADQKEELAEAARRESGRLLYVAMTRARDRLYIAGSHTGDTLPEGCWFDTVKSALEPHAAGGVDDHGRLFWRLGSELHGVSGAGGNHGEPMPVALPDWAGKSAPAGNSRVLLSASALVPPALIRNRFDAETLTDIQRRAASGSPNDALKSSREPASLNAHQPPVDAFFLRAPALETASDLDEWGPNPHDGVARKVAQQTGIFIHRLLEILPGLPEGRRGEAAQLAAAAFREALPGNRIEAAFESVERLLATPHLRPGDKRVLSEAGIAIALESNERAAILGQCDRISIGTDGIELLDYKSGTLSDGDPLPAVYVAQLAAYRLALGQLYPAANIHASLINARSASLLEADAEALDAFATLLAGSLADPFHEAGLEG